MRSMPKMTCPWCGIKFEQDSRMLIVCDHCTRQRETREHEAKEQAKAAKQQRQTTILKDRNCLRCNAHFDSKRNSKRYCDDCGREAKNRADSRERYWGKWGKAVPYPLH